MEGPSAGIEKRRCILMSDCVTCRECQAAFKNDGALHKHLKAHKMTMSDYYTTHFPRKNRLTQDALPFKNKLDYFNTDFSTRAQMIKWCDKESSTIVNEYILKTIKE